MVTARDVVCWLAAALSAFAPGCAHAQHASHHAMTHAPGDMQALGASAAFDSTGTLWAVAKDGEHVVLRRSSDLGRTWSRTGPVNKMPEPIGAEGDARPKIAAGPRDELYVTWTKPLTKPFTGDIRFARSVDGGKSFSAPVTIHADRQEITHRFDAIAVTRAGTIFIAWVDKRDQIAAARPPSGQYAGAAIYYAVSDDRGATFRGDYKITDHSCECCRIALLPVDDRNAIALWRQVFAPDIRDHAFARIHASGRAEKMERATYDDWHIEACPHHGPSLAADGTGALHAVWFTQGDNGAGVFYGRIGKGGVEGKLRIGGETAEHADLAASRQTIVIAWKEFDGERSQLRAMSSQDAGRTWKQAALASTAGPSDQPRVLQHGRHFYVFWNTVQEPFSVIPLP